MNQKTLNALRDSAYKTACKHGFHDQELSNEHWFCLIVSELMEAVEADRSSKRACTKSLLDIMGRQSGWKDELSEEWYRKTFPKLYDNGIKGTVEEELADAAIRVFDLAGLRGINLQIVSRDLDAAIEDMADTCKDETFTESIYNIATLPARYAGLYDLETTINDLLLSILGFARHLGIDLRWHISLKMKYNEHREMMHGKKY